MKMYFALYVVEFIRNLLVIIAALLRKPAIARVYELLFCNDCFGFALLIILHVYRFQYSGKVCSLDNGVAEQWYPYFNNLGYHS